MDSKAMYRITNGLYILSAREGEKDSGCVVNTVQQVTSSPNRISVAVNKQTFDWLALGIVNLLIYIEAISRITNLVHLNLVAQTCRDVVAGESVVATGGELGNLVVVPCDIVVDLPCEIVSHYRTCID